MTPKEIARIHREDILLTLRALEKGTSGKIHKYIHTEIIKSLQKDFEENPWNKIENKKRLDDELGKHRQSKRSIQNWLPILEKERLVAKNDHYEYYLTDKGKKLRIFPDIYGRILLASLVNLPWLETREKNMVEFAKRAGSLILYLFINNLSPISQIPIPVAEELNEKGNLNWIKDAASIDFMFLSFQSKFLRSITRDRNQQIFLIDGSDYEKLLAAYKKKFPRYYKVLVEAEKRFLDKVYKVLPGK